jgi:hypothetical protein
LNKKKLAKSIGVCTLAIVIIVLVTILTSHQSSTPTPPTYGLEFDGIDDYISLGNATALGFTSQDFTIEAWIKPGNVTKRMQIFQRHTWNNDGYRFQTGSSGNLIFYTFQSGDNQGSDTVANVLKANNWYHVVAVRHGMSIKVFVNGIDTTRIAGPHINPAYNAGRQSFIGTSYKPEAFQGYISEVRVWNYARSESEIKADMSGNITGTEAGLIGYWKLKEGSGKIAYDSSPNQNHGTIIGDPVWYTGGS